MRLAFRLMLAVIAMVTMVLVGEAWLHLQHESEVHRADLEHELRSQGAILRESLTALAARDPQTAERFLQGLRETRALQVVLVTAESLHQHALSAEEQAAAAKAMAAPGEQTRFLHHKAELVALTPVLGVGDSGAVLVQHAALQSPTVYATAGMRRVAMQLLLLLMLTVLAAVWTGELLVTRPLETLAGYAHQISTGQFDPSQPSTLRGEFAGLERALRQMAATLAETNTQLIRETEEKTRALEHLRHTDRLRTVGTLAAGIAHDLGTPLQIVLARAERLERKSDEERTRDAGRIIAEQALRMAQIVRQLMRFAAPRRGNQHVQDLRQQVEKACALVAPLDRKIALQIELGEAALPTRVDADHAEQVVVNLVANAIDASSEGDTVTVRLSRVGDAACLEVVDQGCGMDDETVEQAFDPFFTTRDVGQGTGLGLAVVYGIVQEYEGRVQLSSTPGAGTHFTITLPLHEEPA